MAEADTEVEQLGNALEACVERLHAEGVQVKDLDTGLLDFPARGVLLADGEVRDPSSGTSCRFRHAAGLSSR